MKTLQDHLQVPINSPHEQLVHAPNEPLRMVPFKFSYLHLALYSILGVASGGLIFIFSVWYPQIFTYLARTQLPLSSTEDADYMLALVYGKGLHAQWIECPVHRPTGINSNKHDTAKTQGIWFEFKKHRYIYSLEDANFKR
ncbi:hypothetical protein C6341_g13891 [Phytophthora cactorum]|nr:hypothetical protein C6341_g13891 [Phytophthora cactorum]